MFGRFILGMPTEYFSQDFNRLDTELLGNHPVVTGHKINFSTQSLLRPFPSSVRNQIRLGDAFAVDINNATVECDALTRQANYPFNYDLPAIIGLKTDNVASFGRMPDIRQHVHNADLAIITCRFHAVARNPYRRQDKLENKKTAEN